MDSGGWEAGLTPMMSSLNKPCSWRSIWDVTFSTRRGLMEKARVMAFWARHCVAIQTSGSMREQEDVVFPVRGEMKIGVIARVPLDVARLGEKLTRERKCRIENSRAGCFSGPKRRTTLKRIDRLKATLPDGMSLPEMALR